MSQNLKEIEIEIGKKSKTVIECKATQKQANANYKEIKGITEKQKQQKLLARAGYVTRKSLGKMEQLELVEDRQMDLKQKKG